MKNYWLVKTEPDVYSFERLMKEKKTHWDGVRNFQARNNLKKMKAGDFVLVYHSQGPKSVVGVAKVAREFYPDTNIKPDDPKGEWVMVDLIPVKPLKEEVQLQTIKTDPKLKTIPLVKQSRLSVMPLEQKDFERILSLGQTEI